MNCRTEIIASPRVTLVAEPSQSCDCSPLPLPCRSATASHYAEAQKLAQNCLIISPVFHPALSPAFDTPSLLFSSAGVMVPVLTQFPSLQDTSEAHTHISNYVLVLFSVPLTCLQEQFAHSLAALHKPQPPSPSKAAMLNLGCLLGSCSFAHSHAHFSSLKHVLVQSLLSLTLPLLSSSSCLE